MRRDETRRDETKPRRARLSDPVGPFPFSTFPPAAFLEELERTLALLAFEDPSTSPVKDLLGVQRRQQAASELNSAILHAQCQEKEPKLPNLLRQLVWAQGRLEADGGTTTPFEFE